MILIFLGAPGSGKGTQAKRFLQQKNLPQLSTGDMFRAAIQQKTPLGMEAKSLIDKGILVSDEIVVGMVEERIAQKDCQNGFILDGFPRTIPQANSLEELLKKKSKKIDNVVLFDVPDEELIDRLSGRRTCSKCGAVFHVRVSPPKVDGICDKCGSNALIQREDDQMQVIQKRLKVYRDQTEPLVEYYQNKGILQTVDASQNPDLVFQEISRVLHP